MPRTLTVSFANLTCRFGNKFFLLDLADEIVLPALTDESLIRSFGQTSYFFHKVDFRNISDPETEVPQLVVYGKLVKDTILRSEQRYTSDGRLVPADASIPSAPSSFFVLILNNHKLVYVPEMAQAPGLGQFQATLQKFLGIKYRAYVDVLHRAAKASGEPKPKKQIYLEIPHPELDILPMASRGSIQQFLQRFGKLNHLEFAILDTNQEYQMLDTFRALRQLKSSIHSKSTRLIHDDSVGLDKDNALEQINAAAASGNQKVVLSGKSPEGADIRGDNEQFRLSVHPESLPENEAERAIDLVELYQNNVESGILTEDASASTDDEIRRLWEKRRDG